MPYKTAKEKLIKQANLKFMEELHMKKWYQWFYLSLVFGIGGIVNYFDGKSILASIIQVSITVIFSFIQLLCDKKGQKGKKVFNHIGIVVTILLIIWMIYLLLNHIS